jgi:hypothetical protein
VAADPAVCVGDLEFAMKKAIPPMAVVLLCFLVLGELRVEAQSAKLYILPNAAEVGVGAELQLHAYRVTSFNSKQWPPTEVTASWTSSDTSVAVVNRFGRVKGLALGSVTIKATASGTKAGTTIKVGVPVAHVRAPASLALAPNCTGTMTVRIEDAQGNLLQNRPIIWKSSDPNIARVAVVPSRPENVSAHQAPWATNSITLNEFLLSPSRTVLAMAHGGAVITATSEGIPAANEIPPPSFPSGDGKNGATVVNVSGGIEIQPSSLVLDVMYSGPVVPSVRACGISDVPP